MIEASSPSKSTSTSKCERSRSTPASAMDSRTRTRMRLGDRRRVLVRLERCGDGDAALYLCAEIGEQELDGGELRRDVEDVEPADVPEPEDLALQVRLTVRDRDPEARAQPGHDVVGADALRRAHGGDDGAAVLVRREE